VFSLKWTLNISFCVLPKINFDHSILCSPLNRQSFSWSLNIVDFESEYAMMWTF